MPQNLHETPANPPTAEVKLRQENAELRKQLDEALRSRVLDEDYEDFITRALRAKIKIPEWVTRPKSTGRHAR